MKEIGGYFEIEENRGEEYYNYLTFNSSRNSLQFIVRRRNIKKIYLPYYLCLVVKGVLEKEDVEIIYYHIDEEFKPIIENYDNETYVYVVNYFGLLDRTGIEQLNNKYKNMILDNTHAFFLEGFNNIDTIYNCRKYFGVPDGSYLYTNLEEDDFYKEASSMNRIKHLFGRYEDTASKYYESFVNADLTFENCDIELMSRITHNMLRGIDYNYIKNRRSENFKYLHNKLKNINEIEIKEENEYTFAYPLLIKNGNALRKKLIETKIYISKLWPGLDIFPLNTFEKSIFDDLVLLPIDQRYNEDDMEYICKIIKEWSK